MKVNSKIILFIIPLIFVAAAAFGSELSNKKGIVDKHLKGNIPFEKKVKVLVAFQSWADKELTSGADKLNDEELTQVIQFSNLLKAVAAKKLTPKNCRSSMERVIEEDITPISDDPSIAAAKLIEWLKLICPKAPETKQK
jgi:hypothetical protein